MAARNSKPPPSRQKRGDDQDDPPQHLGPAGRALWLRLTKDFVLRDAAARALLQVAAEAADRHEVAREVLRRDGPVYVDRFGAPRSHPAATVARDAHATLISAMRALGLTGAPENDGV